MELFDASALDVSLTRRCVHHRGVVAEGSEKKQAGFKLKALSSFEPGHFETSCFQARVNGLHRPTMKVASVFTSV